MCTLSWMATTEGLTLCFNRDESIARPLAEAPRLHAGEAHSFLAPRDPLGGGTWLAVRADGIALALLNHYGAQPPSAPKHSRGLIVWQLAAAADPADAWQRLTRSLDGVAPFHLIHLRRNAVRIESWDGLALSSRQATWPTGMISTSSSNDPNVLPRRNRAFKKMTEKNGPLTDTDLMRFHEGAHDGDPHSSVWMDRGERRTVSQSRIKLGNSAARFSYRECSGRQSAPGNWNHREIPIPLP